MTVGNLIIEISNRLKIPNHHVVNLLHENGRLLQRGDTLSSASVMDHSFLTIVLEPSNVPDTPWAQQPLLPVSCNGVIDTGIEYTHIIFHPLHALMLCWGGSVTNTWCHASHVDVFQVPTSAAPSLDSPPLSQNIIVRRLSLEENARSGDGRSGRLSWTAACQPMAFSSSGSLGILAAQTTAELWDMASAFPKEWNCVRTLRGHSTTVCGVGMTHNGK